MPILKKVLLILIFLGGCSGPEHSEQEKIRKQNATGELVHRKEGESLYPLAPPKPRERESYPWESK